MYARLGWGYRLIGMKKAARNRVAFLFFLAGAALSIPSQVGAMWARYSETELIAASPLIVMAELIGETTLAVGPGGNRRTVGVLRIGEVLKGDRATTVVLIELPTPGQPQASEAIHYVRGQRGLWFLYATPGTPTGLFRADHPQRFVPAEAHVRITVFRRLLLH